MNKIFLLLILLPIVPAHSAVQGTQTMTLSGTVPITIDISVTPEAGVATNLNLTVSQSNLLVGTVYESSNSASGYKVSAKSANGGQIKNGSAYITYSFTYDGVSGSFPSANTDVTVKTQSAAGLYSSVPSEFRISYTGVPSISMPPGNYSDTITFTLENL